MKFIKCFILFLLSFLFINSYGQNNDLKKDSVNGLEILKKVFKYTDRLKFDGIMFPNNLKENLDYKHKVNFIDSCKFRFQFNKIDSLNLNIELFEIITKRKRSFNGYLTNFRFSNSGYLNSKNIKADFVNDSKYKFEFEFSLFDNSNPGNISFSVQKGGDMLSVVNKLQYSEFQELYNIINHDQLMKFNKDSSFTDTFINLIKFDYFSTLGKNDNKIFKLIKYNKLLSGYNLSNVKDILQSLLKNDVYSKADTLTTWQMQKLNDFNFPVPKNKTSLKLFSKIGKDFFSTIVNYDKLDFIDKNLKIKDCTIHFIKEKDGMIYEFFSNNNYKERGYIDFSDNIKYYERYNIQNGAMIKSQTLTLSNQIINDERKIEDNYKLFYFYKIFLNDFWSISPTNSNFYSNNRFKKDSIIGKPIILEKFEIAQHDFPPLLNWDDAVKVCASLGDGWRLPTKDELQLFYKSNESLSISNNNSYWSSTNFEKGYYWSQYFGDGFQYNLSKNNYNSVRAIRDIDTTKSYTIKNKQSKYLFNSSYSVNNSGESYIYEIIPKLIIGKPIRIGNLLVAQLDMPDIMNFYDATKACSLLGYGWRLPNKNELNLLFKNSVNNNFETDEGYRGYFSSSKPNEMGYENYVLIQDFFNGYIRETQKIFAHKVRAVKSVK